MNRKMRSIQWKKYRNVVVGKTVFKKYFLIVDFWLGLALGVLVNLYFNV